MMGAKREFADIFLFSLIKASQPLPHTPKKEEKQVPYNTATCFSRISNCEQNLF
jgi:hypothetical protein